MPDAVVVRVERVTVAAVRPSTTDRWDGPARDTNGAECRLLEAGASALASPLSGAALGALCDMNAPPQQERTPENPDLQVRLSAGNTRLDSFVEPDALDHVFGYDFVVPTKAIPAEGLRVEVLDADAGQGAETIGVQRLTVGRLAGILASPTGMADLPDGAAQHLEIAVRPYAPMKFGRSQQRASDDPRAVGTRPLIAGEFVSLRAKGNYTIGSYFKTPIGPGGYPNGEARNYNLEAFRSSPHACGVAFVGGLGAAGVTPSATFFARYAGRLSVGVNDMDLRNNHGWIAFEGSSRAPTPAEWAGL